MSKPNPHAIAPWSAAKAEREAYAIDNEWAEKPVARLLADCHPKQYDAVTDPSLLLAICIPRGGSKTTTFMVRAIRTLTSRVEAFIPYIATTKGQATNILWRKVKRAMDAVGIEHRAYEVDKMIVLKKNGSILKLAGADDDAEVDKLRGFPIAALGIDEAALHSQRRLSYLIDEVVGPRLRGWTMLIGTPGLDPSGLFYDVTRPGGELHRPYSERDRPEYADWQGWSSHSWTLKEVSEWAKSRGLVNSELYGAWDEALRKKAAGRWPDDSPKWRREYLGEWAKDDTDNIYKYRAEVDGKPHNRWDAPRVGPLKVAKLPADRTDWLWVLALDRGHSDEFAINGFAFSPSDPQKRIYHVLCHEQKRLYARHVACLLLGARDRRDGDDDVPEPLPTDRPGAMSPYGILGYPIGGVCDSDMTLIDELDRVYRIRCVQAKRAREEKHGAIELINGDLVDGRFKVLAGSPLEAQMSSLQWLTDEFGQLKEPKGKPDHSADCATYARKLIAHLFDSGQVEAPKTKAEKRAERKRAEPDDDLPTYQPKQDAPEWLTALGSDAYEESPW